MGRAIVDYVSTLYIAHFGGPAFFITKSDRWELFV